VRGPFRRRRPRLVGRGGQQHEQQAVDERDEPEHLGLGQVNGRGHGFGWPRYAECLRAVREQIEPSGPSVVE
jgi:hypothetical protein